jgi:ribosomal protein S18 acetylase RimI-like enzyme
MATPTPFRTSSAPAMRLGAFSASGGRGGVVQGLFRSRPFSFAAINPGAGKSNAVQRKPVGQSRPGVDAFQVDLRPKSGGWPLPRDVQAKMEAALGANFSDVRVHVGPEASAIGAIAFTWGSDLHFAPGQYNPHTPHGQFLLGHELAHVVQQRAGRVANPFGSGVAVVQDHALEAEADRLGRMASMSRPAESNASIAESHTHASAPANAVISRKAAPGRYAVRAPMRNNAGWQIEVAPQGSGQAVGSVQLTASKEGVYISNLKVQPEHRRHGLAGQLIDAALRTARSNGYGVAQLEARPDSPADVSSPALVSMYRKLGFTTTGISERGNPVMQHRI